MSIHNVIKSYLILFLLFCVPARTTAAQVPSQERKALWLRELGVSFDGGVLLREPADSQGVEAMTALGGALSLGIFRYGVHRAAVTASYLGFLGEHSDGTRVVEISTGHRQLFGFSGGYDFTWKMLVAGTRVGFGLSYARTQSTLYQVTQQVVGETVAIDRIGVLDKQDRRGNDAGFLGGISVGLEFGRLFHHPQTLEIRALGQALLHGERQDFIAGLTLAFWPSGLWLKLPQ